MPEPIEDGPGSQTPARANSRFQLIALGPLELVVNGQLEFSERFVIVDNHMVRLAQDPDLAVPGFYATPAQAMQAIKRIRLACERNSAGTTPASESTGRACGLAVGASLQAPHADVDATLMRARICEAIRSYTAAGNLSTTPP